MAVCVAINNIVRHQTYVLLTFRSFCHFYAFKDCVTIDEVGHSVSPGVGRPLAPHVSRHVVGGGGGSQGYSQTLGVHPLILLHLKHKNAKPLKAAGNK